MKDTYYFSHDCNALTDVKILNMRAKYGMEGYGLFWVILEMMRTENDYMLQYDKSVFSALKILTNTNVNIEEYINDCINEYELFNKTEDNKFYSNSLLRRMEEKEKRQHEQYLKKSEAGRIGGLKSAEKRKELKQNQAVLKQCYQATKQNQHKEKEKKEKKSKEKENKENNNNAEKIHFADFVTMTNVEYKKLVDTYSKNFADQCITVLDNYKGSSGKTYKSDYRAILTWVVDKVKNQQQQQAIFTNRANNTSNELEKSKDERYERLRKKLEERGELQNDNGRI